MAGVPYFMYVQETAKTRKGRDYGFNKKHEG
jgi:hypothetical protein